MSETSVFPVSAAFPTAEGSVSQALVEEAAPGLTFDDRDRTSLAAERRSGS